MLHSIKTNISYLYMIHNFTWLHDILFFKSNNDSILWCLVIIVTTFRKFLGIYWFPKTKLFPEEFFYKWSSSNSVNFTSISIRKENRSIKSWTVQLCWRLNHVLSNFLCWRLNHVLSNFQVFHSSLNILIPSTTAVNHNLSSIWKGRAEFL